MRSRRRTEALRARLPVTATDAARERVLPVSRARDGKEGLGASGRAACARNASRGSTACQLTRPARQCAPHVRRERKRTPRMPNPCLTCGACCAYYRVSFHWSESERFLGGRTPPRLTAQISPHRVAMLGAERMPPRCLALEGEIGKAVSCSVYALRPSPCREFAASWAGGVGRPAGNPHYMISCAC